VKEYSMKAIVKIVLLVVVLPLPVSMTMAAVFLWKKWRRRKEKPQQGVGTMLSEIKEGVVKAAVDSGLLVGGAAYCGWCTVRLGVNYVYDHPMIVLAGAVVAPAPVGVYVAGAAGIGIAARAYRAVTTMNIGRAVKS
jgi:hypothetical protein